MQRTTIWLLVVTGVVCIIAGAGLLFGSHVAYAQDDDVDYAGSDECSSCHRTLARDHNETAHGLTLQDTESDKERILADFDEGDDLRIVTFPGEDAPRSFTADDIVYAIGAGRHLQQYVYTPDDGDSFYVLPASWNVERSAWQPFAPAESWPDPAYDFVQNCAYCHVTALNVERARWDENGVQCETCHGPGGEHAELADDAGRRPDEEELAELRGAINPAVDPQVCGQCHARGAGAEHPYPLGYRAGADLSESFTLAPLDDAAHWYSSGHASQMNMQYNEWLNTGHALSLTNLAENGGEVDDECLACHSADYAYTQHLIELVDEEEREGDKPDMPTLETAQFGITCTTCHDPHAEPGEMPANLIDESYALCTSCHSNTNFNGEGVHHPVQEMYEGQRIIEQVNPRPSDHFTDANGPTCQTCHLPVLPVVDGTRPSHTMKPLLPGAALELDGVIDTCTACHEDQVDAASMQQLIDDIQTDMRARIETARAAVSEGTPDWVVTALDFVEGDGSFGIHNYAYTDALLDAVDAELGLFPAADEER